jgi:hypothetical protein
MAHYEPSLLGVARAGIITPASPVLLALLEVKHLAARVFCGVVQRQVVWRLLYCVFAFLGLATPRGTKTVSCLC